MAMKASVTVFLFLSLFGLNTSFYRKPYYVNSLMNWTDAQQYCRNNYDDLSTASYEEWKVLSANPLIINLYWIGLYRDVNNLTLWRWTGGEEATNVVWDPNQPNGQLSYDIKYCGAVMKSTSKANDAPCSLLKQFYCMSYELIVVQQESTWEEALLYCRQNYIDLAILSSDELMTEAEDKTTQALTDDVWIGLRFLAGHWFWVNGEDIGDKFWSAGEELQCPAMDQRCGVYDPIQNIWKPTDCERRLNFLCVKKPWN